MTADLLDAIVAGARRIVQVRECRAPLSVLEKRIERAPRAEAFRAALSRSPAPRIIAECKRRSPSKGILRQAYDPPAHARAYASAGAAAISVLTEPTFFDGRPAHLVQVRGAVEVPILRKDFIVTDYQLVETVALGGDAVLLIVAALDDRALRRLIDRASALGLAALVEVHSDDELQRAVNAGAEIVGVNSRDLRTLAVDPRVLETVIERVPPGLTMVAESGIRTAEDIRRLSSAGYDAFLVGERLISREDPGAALRELREQ